MFNESLTALHGYLKRHVVTSRSVSSAILGSSKIISPTILEFEGILYEKSGAQWECYDRGGIFDEVEGFVEGDHYATSHYTLMCALLYLSTGEQDYLNDIEQVEDFCLKQLSGYPRVRWGMHFDFNNYAIAWTLHLLGDKISVERQRKWKAALLTAPINRHRVGNWWGQRTLYACLLRQLGPLEKLKATALDILYKRKFVESLSADGCFEDKVDSSRPVQYHAFSLGLALAVEHYRPGNFSADDLLQSLAYLRQFISPTADYNFFGRGHKQIFAYSPAIFSLLTTELDEDRDLAKSMFDFVRGYQLITGDFPLVLSPNDKAGKVGWYDYHRHSVYNAFFGAWLALAQYQLETGSFTIKKVSSSKRRVSTKIDTSTYRVDNNSYFAFLTNGYSHYGSECGFAFHKLLVRGLGDVVSCPGGPVDAPLGFGSINRFEHEQVNYFSPLVLENRKFYGPGRTPIALHKKSNSVIYTMTVKNVSFNRAIAFEENTIVVNDRLENLDTEPKTVRLFNLPLNLEEKRYTPIHGGICVTSQDENSKSTVSIVTDCDIAMSLEERYPWVDGNVQIFAISAQLEKTLTITTTINIER